MLEISSLGSPLSIQISAGESKWCLVGFRATSTDRGFTLMTISMRKPNSETQIPIAPLKGVRGTS